MEIWDRKEYRKIISKNYMVIQMEWEMHTRNNPNGFNRRVKQKELPRIDRKKKNKNKYENML